MCRKPESGGARLLDGKDRDDIHEDQHEADQIQRARESRVAGLPNRQNGHQAEHEKLGDQEDFKGSTANAQRAPMRPKVRSTITVTEVATAARDKSLRNRRSRQKTSIEKTSPLQGP